MCSSCRLWMHWKSTVDPSGLSSRQSTGTPGARSARPEHRDAVVGLDEVVGGGVGEDEGEHALLLEVGLVDAGEGADHDHPAPEEAGLHGRVLPGRPLAVVLVAHRHPRLARVAVVLGHVGEGLGLAVDGAQAGAGLAGEGVDGPQEQVAADVLQVAPVLSHRPAAEMWSVVHLPTALSRTAEADEVLAVPRGEGLQPLQPGAGRVDDHLDPAAVRRAGRRSPRRRRRSRWTAARRPWARPGGRRRARRPGG